MNKYLSFNQLQTKLGDRSRSAIYNDLESGRIPKPLKIGRRCYWKEQDIDATMDKLMETSS
jgi:predicted DNA-binding transcriptional regulator AlpA